MLHPEKPEKAGAAKDICKLYGWIYIPVASDTIPFCWLMHPEWDLLLYLLQHLWSEGMLRGGAFVAPSGIKMLIAGDSELALFLLLPTYPFSRSTQKKASVGQAKAPQPMPGSCSALYMSPEVQMCWGSHFCFSSDLFEQVNGESFSYSWESRNTISQATLQWEESKWR